MGLEENTVIRGVWGKEFGDNVRGAVTMFRLGAKRGELR